MHVNSTALGNMRSIWKAGNPRNDAIEAQLRGLVNHNLIRPIDCHFALFVISKINDSDQLPDDMLLMAMLCALVSNQLNKQHTCVELDKLKQPFASIYRFPHTNDILQATSRLGLRICEKSSAVQSIQKLLVVDDNKLYLTRYWHYELLIHRFITRRLQETAVDISDEMSQQINALFPRSNKDEDVDWQKVAVFLACTRSLTVITGGPGTGKTTTVAKLIAALAMQKNNKLEVKLVAPTGKAAARLAESMQSARNRLSVDAAAAHDLIKIETSTIHRLLGYIPGSQHFRHNNAYPILADVLIIDEASMIDLALLAKLLDAVPETSRVVMLGDANQLSSVEVGSVFADICAVKDDYPAYTERTKKQLYGWLNIRTDVQLPQFCSLSEESPAFRDNLVELTKSHRFSADSGIGQLAFMVNAGDVNKAVSFLEKGAHSEDVQWGQALLFDCIWQQCVGHLNRYFAQIKQGDYLKALEMLSQLQVLCLTRTGRWGVAAMNQRIEQAISNDLHVDVSDPYYSGRPIMVTSNNYERGLYNGDIGVCGISNSGVKVVYFEREGSIVAFLPAQLPQHETTYAMTIHKSQGSEFTKVILLMERLGMASEEMLTRELLYTGITRAKKEIAIYAEETVFKQAIKCRTRRSSGLANRLLK